MKYIKEFENFKLPDTNDNQYWVFVNKEEDSQYISLLKFNKKEIS